jgi:two-component system response regulator YesN
MLKVLIIDDEPIIRNGLKTIIDWNKYGFEIVGDAADGIEGLNKCQELKPDLIIADVRMPGMDGLEMIETLQKKDIDCKFIILSAYSDFEYAQKAIELGAKFYILKPIEESELIDKLEKVYETIKNEREIKQSIFLSRDKALENIILGHYEESYNEVYNLGFPWKAYQVVLLHLCEEGVQAKEIVRNKMVELVLYRFRGYVVDVEGDICLLMENDRYDQALICFFADILSKLERILNIRLFIALGRPVCNTEDINISYVHARRLMNQRFLLSKDGIIADIQSRQLDTTVCDMDVLLDKLYGAIDSGNTLRVDELIEDFKNSFILKNASEEIIKISYVNLYTMIVDRIRASERSLSEGVSINENIIDKAYSALNLKELHEDIKGKLISLSEELAQKRPYSLMEKMLDYINRNYNQDIKLNKLADIFGYNSAYLGKLFKDFTGDNFNDYLNKARIEKAKEFLRAGMKVSQAAERVGYKDVDYFYRMFKKYTGDIPSTYKK